MSKQTIVSLVTAFCICQGCSTSRTQQAEILPNHSASYPRNRPDLNQLQTDFGKFTVNDSSSVYEIKLCADVPYDKNPTKVVHKKEPGHVFLIFSQSVSGAASVNQVFGYYPVRPATVVFGKNVKSQVRNNSGRVYDAEISMSVRRERFFALLDSSIILATKKYNLNKFNCYDYGLEIFNQAVGTQVIPIQYVKFPFIWGRGGSPTGLYSQLRLLKEMDSLWAPYIQFGQLKAPNSD